MRSRWCSLVERTYDFDMRIPLHDLHHRTSLGALVGRFEQASQCNDSEFAVKYRRRGVASSSSLTSNPHLVRLSQTSSTIASNN
jgi:hypothetical protein